MSVGGHDIGGTLPRRGRLRPRENTPPPLWFGLVFLLGGLFFAGLGIAYGGLPFTIIGGLFALIGAAMTLTTLTAQRGRRPVRADTAAGPVDVFTRSPMRILIDLLLAPLGGVGFILFSPVWLGVGPLGLLFTGMFVFFGLIMLKGAAITVRRGVRREIAEVGPDGIWTAELPRRLAWDEIERLEVEAARGAAGEGTAVYTRLGIWPRDEGIAAIAPGRSAVGMVRGFTSLTNVRGGDQGLSDPARMAPYGITAFEVEQDFAEVLRSVGRYAQIVGAPERPDEPFEPAVIPATPAPGGLVGAVLAKVAGGTGGVEAAAPPPIGLPGWAAHPSVTAPSAAPDSANEPAAPTPPLVRTFERRPGVAALSATLGQAWTQLVFAGAGVLFLGVMLSFGSATLTSPIVLPFLLIPVAFLAIGIVGLLDAPSRWRMARGDPRLATVDDGGLELKGMGRLAWSQIDEVRVATAPVPVGEHQPAIGRLEVVPLDPARLEARHWSERALDRVRAALARWTPFVRRRVRPGAFGLDLDLVADPEGLLDAIARYRLVDER
jgi:hypothetical protein